MRISAQLAMWLCAAFATVCFVFAMKGFTGLGDAADAAERELITGYAWYWTFLGVVALVFGVLSWMMKTGRLGALD
jgi:hypothetical protein